MRGFVDGVGQRLRGAPHTASSNEARGGIDHGFLARRFVEGRAQGHLGPGPLLPAHQVKVDAAVRVDAHESEVAHGDANRESAVEFDDDIGHANPLSSEDRQEMGAGIAKDPIEGGVREARKGSVPGDEESAVGQAHAAAA
jgi:hypothetical protein